MTLVEVGAGSCEGVGGDGAVVDGVEIGDGIAQIAERKGAISEAENFVGGSIFFLGAVLGAANDKSNSSALLSHQQSALLCGLERWS